MNRAVFLDRDGVINRKAPEGAYVTRWEEVEFLPRVGEAIQLLRQANFRIIVVSNQRAVAKGLLTLAALEEIHRRMLRQLDEEGAALDAIYYCPHDLQPPCTCRKPAPGMLLQAAQEHGIDLAHSWMVGDSDIDIQAGKSTGCKTVRILRPGVVPGIEADQTAASLFDAAQQLIHLA
jgi:D-glycero-D-manno-heptose 1,7-bisphosphate phosphatase